MVCGLMEYASSFAFGSSPGLSSLWYGSSSPLCKESLCQPGPGAAQSTPVRQRIATGDAPFERILPSARAAIPRYHEPSHPGICGPQYCSAHPLNGCFQKTFSCGPRGVMRPIRRVTHYAADRPHKHPAQLREGRSLARWF